MVLLFFLLLVYMRGQSAYEDFFYIYLAFWDDDGLLTNFIWFQCENIYSCIDSGSN